MGTAYKTFFFLLIPLVFLAAHEGQAASDPAPLSFVGAWEMVVSNSDALKAAQENIAHAEYKQGSAKALYLPEIKLTAAYIHLDDDIKIKPDDLFESMPAGHQIAAISSQLAQKYGLPAAQIGAGLTSTMAEQENFVSAVNAIWPIYTGGRITAAQQIAAGMVDEAGDKLRLERLQQFQHLVDYYFGAVLTRTIHQTRMEVETGLKKHLDHAVMLEKQGQIAKVERMQAEAAYDKAIVERKKAWQDHEIALAALTELLKSNQPVSPADQLFIENSLPEMDTFIQHTLQSHPGLAALAAKQKQAEGLLAAERGRYLPTIALFGNYTLHEDDSLAAKTSPDWLAGLGASLPLIDRSGRRGDHLAAKSSLRRIGHLKNQARSDLKLLVEKTYRQARQALEEYQGLRSSQELAQETVSLRIKAFSQGISTSLDVVDAELFLAQVKTQRAAAMYNHVKALGTLVVISSGPEDFFQYQQGK
ncbi:MAG: hypothetical protein CSB24_03340 [Deltaproteobacteria bacterium]|nr:MAG: hypothetical protein CSB24_03340 [Deltaproteobacteria bacterium]